jgi:hypothetical protein
MKSSKEFFWLHDQHKPGVFWTSFETGIGMDKIFSGEVSPPAPILCKHSMGRKLYDFVWAVLYPLIHTRVIDLLTPAKISGWSTYRVKVTGPDGTVIPEYHGLSIRGRCGSITFNKAEIVVEKTQYGTFRRYKGLNVTEDSWDGSDMFIGADHQTTFILVTERVYELFRDEKVGNVDFEPKCEVRVPGA